MCILNSKHNYKCWKFCSVGIQATLAYLPVAQWSKGSEQEEGKGVNLHVMETEWEV